MIYKVLGHDEVQQLNDDLVSRLPGTAKIFYVIRNFLKGLLPGKEVIVDQWPQWSSIIVRTADPDKAQPFFRNSYMCHARSVSALKYFLQRPGVVDWRQPATFTGVPRDVAPLIANLCRKHLGTLSSIEPRFMYAWTRREPPPEPIVPDGLHLGTLGREEDAGTLRLDWEGRRYKEDLQGYFSTVIEHFNSSCLRDDNGELLAYICMQYNGSMAMLYVKPEHRDKNYFKIVLADLARKRLSMGEVAYGFIPANDASLVSMMRDMEFMWVPGGDMVWMHYEPLKINRKSTSEVEEEMTSSAHDYKCACVTAGRDCKDGILSCRVCAANSLTQPNELFFNAVALVSEKSHFASS